MRTPEVMQFGWRSRQPLRVQLVEQCSQLASPRTT